MKATAKDLRLYSKELLETVARGEEVVITFRGKPMAKIVPLDVEDKTEVEKISLFGIWEDHEMSESVEEYIEKPRESRF